MCKDILKIYNHRVQIPEYLLHAQDAFENIQWITKEADDTMLQAKIVLCDLETVRKDEFVKNIEDIVKGHKLS